ncbi:MAG: YigZ family protein [Clostridia bacterium]|jgi:uncharacterized YigZ family protein
MLQKEYKTILGDSHAKYEEKKSKFIAHAKSVSDEKEALEFINSKRTEFWDATHNVFSYNVFEENFIQRSSDDGEPQGTAGLPVMEIINKSGLQNIVIVVTRYFGGTQLGASGLIRAYGKSASLCIDAAVIIKKVLCYEINLMFEYSLIGKLQNNLMQKGYEIKNTKYEKDVEMTVLVPYDEFEKFTGIVNEALNARVIIDVGDKVYQTIKLT